MIHPVPLPERQEFIRDLLSEPQPHETYPVEFQGRRQHLPIHRVSLDFPVYRLQNGRTLAAQLEYIATHGKPADFFTHDPDSSEALTAQHEILRGMKDEAHLFAVLRENPQSVPLVLTRDGYIANGNRRACVFRILLEMDPRRYHHFSNVEVVFLPPCTAKDIDEFEAQEQIVPEVKAKYEWVTEAMLLRERQQLHRLSLNEVASFYDMKPSVAREKLQMLDAADQYLAARGRPHLYSQLAKAEYAFKTLVSLRGKLADPAKQDLFTELVFAMVDQEAEGNRVYAQIKQLFKNLNKAIHTLRTELPGPPPTVPATPEAREGRGLDLFGGDEQEELAQLVRQVADPANHAVVVDVIADTIEEQAQRERQRQIENSFMEKVQQAYTALEAAITELNPESCLAGVGEYLTNIEAAVDRIRSKIAEYDED